MIELRPYQQGMVDDIRGVFGRRIRRVLAVASTGAGKTVIFCYIAMNAAAKGRRVVIIAHRIEIVDQISKALDRFGVRHGRIAPGHSMTDDLVQVAMVQTLARRLHRVLPPDLLVIDEAHHSAAGTWCSVTSAWDTAKILGVTATPIRSDGKGLAEHFDEMVLGPPMVDLIDQKFLSRYTLLAPPQVVDLSHVKTRGGDFAVDELGEAMNRSTITGDAIEHYRAHLGGRPAIVFCVTIDHAKSVAEQFRSAGYRSASVDGDMDLPQRRDVIASIGDGRLNVLTSCQVVSEGTDLPAVAGALLLRPTKSLGLYLQMVGRVLRPKPDGGAAVILDHVGNVHRHGMPDAPRIWALTPTKDKQTSEPVHTCEQCFRVFAGGSGWRDDAECIEGQPEGCILVIPPAEEPKPMPEVVDGTLEVITSSPVWAGGVNVLTAAGPEYSAMMRHADTPEKLQQIATMRGYKRGWVQHILRSRHGHRVAAE